MTYALSKWAAYKWGSLGDEEHEKYPKLYWLAEVISDNLKLKLDYRKGDGQWEEGLIVLPKRSAKLKEKVFLHGYCEQWKRDWYFRMDRMRNIDLAAESEQKGAGVP